VSKLSPGAIKTVRFISSYSEFSLYAHNDISVNKHEDIHSGGNTRVQLGYPTEALGSMFHEHIGMQDF